jgi:RNA polymerase sigma-70 factor, ECF subfamily
MMLNHLHITSSNLHDFDYICLIMNMTVSDSELSIRQLFNEYFHQLVFSSFRIVNDYHQAEDIVQDVFVKIWQNFDRIDQKDELKSYLFRAVHNSSLNFLRHMKVKQKYMAQTDDPNLAVVKPIEDTITENETNNRIHRAVNKLPDTWKEAFILSKYDKLKYHEIAKEMGISQKTVEKYISKSLHFLRKELTDILLIIIFFYNNFLKL